MDIEAYIPVMNQTLDFIHREVAAGTSAPPHPCHNHPTQAYIPLEVQ
jgi:hypothetical protein